MTVLSDIISWLFFVPENRRTFGNIVRWWEKRRIPFNLIVGSVGLCSLVLFYVFIKASGKLNPGEDPVEPLPLIAAPILMNVCYTAGWIVEAVLNPKRSAARKPLAPTLFKYGLIFSLTVVLLPAVFWGVYVLLLTLGIAR